jgi:amino acid transporter
LIILCSILAAFAMVRFLNRSHDGIHSYAMQWTVVLPLEIIAGALTIGYWNPDVPKAIFVTLFLVVIVAINLLGIRGYGEAEFIFAIVKVTAVIAFM